MSAKENEYGFAQRRIDSVRQVTLTEVTTTEGAGVVGDVVHRMIRFYDSDGTLVGLSPSWDNTP